MVGAIFRQDAEFKIKGGGLICLGLADVGICCSVCFGAEVVWLSTDVVLFSAGLFVWFVLGTEVGVVMVFAVSEVDLVDAAEDSEWSV